MTFDQRVTLDPFFGQRASLQLSAADGTDLIGNSNLYPPRTVMPVTPDTNGYSDKWSVLLTDADVVAIDNSNFNSGVLIVNSGRFLNRSGEYQIINQRLRISLIVPRNDTTDLTSSSKIQAITAQTRLASQLSTQTVRTTSHRLHFLRREHHAKRRSGSRNQLNSQAQNPFTPGLKVHFSNPDIDRLIRRAVLANQLNAGPTGDTWRLFRENITQNLKTWSPWVSGQITVGQSKDDANGGDWDIRIRELTYGMDRAIGDHRVGLSLGFATDKADNDAFRVKGRHYTLAGYGAYTLSQGDNWSQYLHGVLGIGWLDSDIRRTQAGVNYNSDRDGLNRLLSLSYLLEIDRDGFILSPYLRYDRSAIRLGRYTESAGSDALGYEKQKLDAEYLAAGLTLDTVTGYRSGTLKPYAQLEYRHDVSAYDDSISYRISDPTNRSTIDGEKRAPRQWLAGLGLRYQRDAIDVDVRYEHAQSTNNRDDRDSVEVKLRWAF